MGIIKKVVSLKQNKGRTLTTSDAHDFSGLFGKLAKCTDLATYKPDFPLQTIINFSNSNIERAIDLLETNGELITYTDKLPSNSSVCKKIHDLGTITDIINDKEKLIWKFVKGNLSHKTMVNGVWKNFTLMNDAIMFLSKDYSIPFTDLFTIKVGAISGLDEAFINSKGNLEFVTSQTPQNGSTKRMFFNCFDESMLKFKKKLLDRKIKKFNETNWWMWGRGHHISERPRVYVPCKTRQEFPFFHHDSLHYDGTVLAIFCEKKVKAKLPKIVNLLNKVNWDELGFRFGKRYIFSQKTLENIRLPKEFASICV